MKCPKPSKTHSLARRAMFTEYGYIALESVITRRLSHRRAISSLLCLRDLITQPEGPSKQSKVKQYFAEHKMLKGTDLSYLNG